MTFRVLMTSALFEPGFRGGGPIRSVARIVDTAPEDIDVLLITGIRDLGTTEPYPGLSGRCVPRGRAHVFYLDTRSVRQWLRVWRTVRHEPLDLLYVNSLLNPRFSLLPVLAVFAGLIRPRNVLIAPRGELSPGALSLKARKKAAFLKICMPLLRRLPITWHASTEMESSDITTLQPGADVVVVENQTALPDVPCPVEDARPGPARMIFVSRISPKKNLDLVLEALGSLEQPVDLDIYGPVEDADYWKRCQGFIAVLPEHVRVEYRGELLPAQVRETFADYDLFTFPTKGENFGHVIAESLSASCPVLCSDQTPWTSALENGGGLVVEELSPQAVAMALEEVSSMSPEGRLELRRGAGEAYRRWRSNVVEENVLDRMRRRGEYSVAASF